MRNFLKYILLIPIFFFRKIEDIYQTLLSNFIGNNFVSLIRTKYLEKNDKIFQEVVYENKNSEIFKAKFFTPNNICQMRANTFSTKEPEILEWLDDYGKEGIFFDIGANIGLYSIYFSQINRGISYAFEPSVFNLAQLAKNISINKLTNKINIVTNPLSNLTSFSKFINSNTEIGGALNAFGVEYGYDGKQIKNNIEYSILGFSIDFMFEVGLLNKIPSMIKIDVDGIEHLILEGAKKTIRNKNCKTIYIEVNDNFKIASNEINRILKDSGFSFKEKRVSKLISDNNRTNSTFNQIWVKSTSL